MLQLGVPMKIYGGSSKCEFSLACQTVCAVGAANKPSDHCCTHSGTTSGMLAEPIRSLRGL